MKEETERWIGKAKEDLEDARFNVEGGRGRLGAFMLQQALEKALKALHIERSGRYEYTHNLVRLATELDVPEGFQETFEVLTPLYTGFRYPDVAEGEIEDAAELLKSTEEIVKWIERQLTR